MKISYLTRKALVPILSFGALFLSRLKLITIGCMSAIIAILKILLTISRGSTISEVIDAEFITVVNAERLFEASPASDKFGLAD